MDRIPALFLALLNGMHERRIWKETLSILCLVGAKMLGLVFCTVLSQAQFQQFQDLYHFQWHFVRMRMNHPESALPMYGRCSFPPICLVWHSARSFTHQHARCSCGDLRSQCRGETRGGPWPLQSFDAQWCAGVDGLRRLTKVDTCQTTRHAGSQIDLDFSPPWRMVSKNGNTGATFWWHEPRKTDSRLKFYE